MEEKKPKSVRKRTVSNFIWRLAERAGAQIIQFIVSIVLTRLLLPEDYGTVALVFIFTQVLQVFVESGLGNALIQKKDADDLDFSSVFYFYMAWCLFLYAVSFFGAPFVAEFYHDESLTPIMRVLCIMIIISGLKNVQQAYVSRHLQFKKFFWATLAGTLLSGVAGIAVAMMGGGAWALVVQKLTNLAVDTLVLWFIIDWRPKLMFSFQRLKGLLSYGWKIMVPSVVDALYNNLSQVLIGKFYTPSELAYYNQGRRLPDLIVTNINTSIDSVLFPTLSREQDDRSRVKAMTRRAIMVSTYLMAPLMMGLAFCGNTIVTLLMTEKWLPIVPFMYIFCVTSIFFPIQSANQSAIKAMGRSDLFLKFEIIKKIVGVVALLSTIWFGVYAIALSWLGVSLFSQIINAYPNRRLLGYGYLEQLKDVLPAILLAVFMGACVHCIEFLPLPLIVTLLLQLVVGAGIYLGGSKLFHMEAYTYMLDTVKSFLKKKKKDGTEESKK